MLRIRMATRAAAQSATAVAAAGEMAKEEPNASRLSPPHHKCPLAVSSLRPITRLLASHVTTAITTINVIRL